MSIGDFAGMTMEQFLGSPRISPDLIINLLPINVSAEMEPILDGSYFVKLTRDRSVALKDDLFIAAFMRGSETTDSIVYVVPEFRGLGVASELVYRTVIRFPGATPARTRNQSGQAVYESVWRRIQRELGANQ